MSASQSPPDDAVFDESVEELYEHAPCGYLSTTPAGMIVKVNQTFVDWTGQARAELVSGRRFQDLLTAGGRIFYETHLAPLLAMQGSAREIALDFRRADGRVLPALVNIDQKRDAAGRARGHRLTVFNVSERREYERELVLARKRAEQAAQAKADFVSMVSHEIRTPLNAVLGVAHLLDKTSPTAQQAKYLRILKSSSEALLALVNDVLDFSKIEAGKATLEERPFEPRELLMSIAHSLGVKADEKQIELRMEIDERVPPMVLGDPLKLRQVLTNLVGNAIKFTQKGFVRVGLDLTESDDDTVLLAFRVQDTGIGIASDRLEHIFEAFTQASYDVGVKFGGTGLGLAISRKLLELYGAKFEVQSTPGEGSTFAFALRLRKSPDVRESLPSDADTTQANTLRGLRVLIADDNDVNIFVLSGFLKRWGAEFDVAENGRVAIERLGQRRYDAVLMDLRMPEVDGYAATRAIRALPDERLRNLPVIATSASIRIGEEKLLEAAGFTDFVGKPINPDTLHRVLLRYAAPV